MATIIDSLIVTLGLDGRPYQKGSEEVRSGLKKTKEAAHGAAVDMEGSAKRASGFFGSLKNEVAGLLVTFAGTASLKGFISDIVGGDAAASRFARNIGVSTNAVSAWGYAMRDVNGNASDAMQSLGALSEMYQNYMKTGQSGFQPQLGALGIYDPKILKDPEEGLLRLADAATRLKKATGDDARFASLAASIGMTPATIRLLEMGRGELTRLINEKKNEAAASGDQGKAAEELQKKWGELYGEITGRLRPGLYSLIDGLLGVTKDTKTMSTVADIATMALVGLGGAALWIAAPFLGVAAAIAVVIGGLDWIIRNSPTVRQKLDDWEKPLRDMTPEGLQWIWKRHGVDDGAAGAGVGAGGAPGASGGSTARMFKDAGFNDEQIKGMAAGVFAEGGHARAFNRAGGGRGARGIGQWRGARLDNFKRVIGKDVFEASEAEQFRFMAWELTHTHKAAGDRIKRASNSEEALRAYIDDYMIPGAAGAAGDMRRGRAWLGTARRSLNGGYRVGGAGGGGGGSVVNTTHVGTIVVHAGNKSPEQMAAELTATIRRRGLTAQADRGLD